MFPQSVLCIDYRTAIHVKCTLYIMPYLETPIHKVMFKLTGTDCIFLLNDIIRVAIRSEADVSGTLIQHSIPFIEFKCSTCHLSRYHLEMTNRYFEF
jgi:hypothetical protein